LNGLAFAAGAVIRIAEPVRSLWVEVLHHGGLFW
jgi:hypothetical protein